MPFFSANSHLIEPAHVFEGRVPAKWAERAPRVVGLENGGQQWIFEEQKRPLIRSCAIAGMPEEIWGNDIINIREIRPGCYDAASRLADMDLDGVDVTAILSSPASIGFGADLFAKTRDPELAEFCVRAWNDWYFDEWISVSPERFVPVGCASYLDPKAAAAEVYRNADRGFKAVTFRNPVDLDLPWVGTGHFDPFFRACEETGTVVFHHTEQSPWWPRPVNQQITPYPYGMYTTLFQSAAMEFVNSMIWGGLSVRFPRLKITVAESGGSWLPHLIKHMTWAIGHTAFYREGWPDLELLPIDMLKRTFVFSTLELDTAIEMERDYGLKGWMIEDDFPHCESVWPNTNQHYTAILKDLDRDHFERLTWRNASELFRHPIREGGYIGHNARQSVA